MSDIQNQNRPLADRMRPENLGEFLGQDEIIGKGKLLRDAIESDQAPSMILWGPPGSGKTTLAHIIASRTESDFRKLSAVASGIKDLREIIKIAEENQKKDKRTILFIVEEFGNLPVPLHIRNAPTKLMKDLGYGKDYKYSPKFDYQEKQEYLPEKLKGRKYLN